MVWSKRVVTGLVVLVFLYSNGMSNPEGKHVAQETRLGSLTSRGALPIIGEIEWWNDPALKTSHALVVTSAGSAYSLASAVDRLEKYAIVRTTNLRHQLYNLRKVLYTSDVFALLFERRLLRRMGLNREDLVEDEVGSLAKRVYDENPGKSIFAVSTRPTLDVKEGLASGDLFHPDDKFFHPNAYTLASRIYAAARKMPADRKIILVGKSMGGCQMMKAANKLKRVLDIDLLVIVDASCSIEPHLNDYRNINTNVNEAFSFYQRKKGERQNGYPILQNGYQLRENTNVSRGFCLTAGHAEIDTCEPLLYYVSYLVKRTILGVR